MKISSYPRIISLLLITFCIHHSNFAQSWQNTTFNFAPDTVVSSTIVCDYDNSGTTYFAGAYYEITNFDYGFYLWKVNSSGIVTGKTRISTNSTLWEITSVKKLKFIGGALYLAADARYQTGIQDYDAFIMKFNTSFVKQWERFQNRIGDPNDFGVAIEAGPNSSVIFAGNTGTLGYINKYNRADGSTLASNVIDPGVGLGTATVKKLIVKNSNIFVGGDYQNSIANIYVQRYDGALVKKWSNIFDPSGNASDAYFYDMVLDTAGNPGVCGYYEHTSLANRAFITKYNKTTGNTPWTRKISIDNTEGRGIGVDASGNFICVTTGSTFPRFVKLSNTNGAILTNKTIFNSAQVQFVPTKLCQVTNGVTYVLGSYDSTYNPGTGIVYQEGVCITRLNDAGNREWNKTFISTRPDWIRTTGDIAVYNNTLLYSVKEQDISLIPKEFYVTYGKLNATTGLKTSSETLEEDQIVMYPNPATTTLHLSIPYTDESALAEVYDTKGRLILAEQMFIQSNEIQTLPLEQLSPGYYLLKINVAGKLITRKFIKE